MSRQSKFVQIAVSEGDDNGYPTIVALGEDGQVWFYYYNYENWQTGTWKRFSKECEQ